VFLVIAFSMPGADPSRPGQLFFDWGWRIPFLCSAVMVVIGLWVRLRLVEAPAFARAKAEDRLVRVPVARVFRTHWRQLLLGTFAMLATYVVFYLVSSWTLSYGTGSPATGGLGYSYYSFVLLTIGGCVFFAVSTLLSGPLADRFGRRPTLLVVQLAMIVFGGLFVPLLGGGLAGVIAYLVIGFLLMGLTFGPMAALLPELFPTALRYTGSGIAYNVSSILGAAVAPLVATALIVAAGGSPWLVGVYLSAMAAISFVALLLTRETKDAAIEE